MLPTLKFMPLTATVDGCFTPDFPSRAETAIAEAKELEKMGFKSRVTRETYNTEENSYEENDIYVSRTQTTAATQPVPKAGGGGGVKGGGAGISSSVKPASKRKNSAPRSSQGAYSALWSISGVGNFGRLAVSLIKSKAFSYIVLIVLVGFMAGMAVIRLLPDVITWLWNQGYHLDLRADSYDKIMLGAFIGGFLVVAGPLTLMLMPKMFGKKTPEGAEEEITRENERVQKVRHQKLRNFLDVLSRQALMEDDQAFVEPEDPSTPDMDDTPEPPSAKPELEIKLPETPPPSSAEDVAANSSLAGSEAASKLRTFVDSAINAIKLSKTQLDNYNKFAVHLYIAGAVDILGDAKNLVAAERRRLTANALSTLGTKGELANQFYEKVRDYTVEERYRKMVDLGRSAMEDYLKGAEGSAHGQLTGAIQEWSRGSTGSAATATMTVMFTDMVGSTDMTKTGGMWPPRRSSAATIPSSAWPCPNMAARRSNIPAMASWRRSTTPPWPSMLPSPFNAMSPTIIRPDRTCL